MGSVPVAGLQLNERTADAHIFSVFFTRLPISPHRRSLPNSMTLNPGLSMLLLWYICIRISSALLLTPPCSLLSVARSPRAALRQASIIIPDGREIPTRLEILISYCRGNPRVLPCPS